MFDKKLKVRIDNYLITIQVNHLMSAHICKEFDMTIVHSLPSDDEFYFKKNGKPAKAKVKINVFPYFASPSNTVIDLKEYIKDLSIQLNDAFTKSIASDSKKLLKTQINKIKVIYLTISHPLDKPVHFRFSVNKNVKVTYGSLLYLNTIAYQYIYNSSIITNDETIPRCERRLSNGNFKIWGYMLHELKYNGYSQVNIYDDYIICKFKCDSYQINK